jgi:hypothetical protein
VEGVKIVLFSLLAAIAYGILHDQVTAHLCVEYFTIGHPLVFPTKSPFLLAIGWGVLATWWLALPLGLLLALAARLGSEPRVAFGEARSLVLMLLAVMACSALLAGVAAAVLPLFGVNPVPLAEAFWMSEAGIPAKKQTLFVVDLWAHSASYLTGVVGALVVLVLTIRRRIVRRRALVTP